MTKKQIKTKFLVVVSNKISSEIFLTLWTFIFLQRIRSIEYW